MKKRQSVFHFAWALLTLLAYAGIRLYFHQIETLQLEIRDTATSMLGFFLIGGLSAPILTMIVTRELRFTEGQWSLYTISSVVVGSLSVLAVRQLAEAWIISQTLELILSVGICVYFCAWMASLYTTFTVKTEYVTFMTKEGKARYARERQWSIKPRLKYPGGWYATKYHTRYMPKDHEYVVAAELLRA